ncbi:the Rna recognition motif in peptidyl prolyl Cis-Trans isomerase E, partial [Catenaria anguillulae PL171]
YTGGLAPEVNRHMLENLFIAFGDIVNVDVPFDPIAQCNRGFAFVTFEDPEDALAAIDNLHLSEISGRTIKVNLANAAAMSASGQRIQTKAGMFTLDYLSPVR